MAGKYCLPQNIVSNIKKLLKSGEIDVEKMSKMTSEERHRYLSDIVGKDHATAINGLFEKQLLSKNFYSGMEKWVKTITGITPQVRKDMLAKIEKMVSDSKGNLLTPEEEKNFMSDLIETKIGVNLSPEEAKTATILSNKLTSAREIFDKTGNGKEYGATQSAMERFLSDAKKKGISDWSWNPLKMTEYIASNMKAIAASLDNSFALRQGIKTLFTHPIIWSKSFLKSFSDLAKGFKNGRNDVIDGIKAEIYSRKNSIDGTYSRMKIEIGGVEEAYAGTLGQKIPVFRKLFDASEAAYEGMGIRLRADLADKLIDKATKQGVDLTDTVQAESIGKLINSLTGRGSIGKLNVIGKEINAAFFSIKFMKGNYDVLTAHTFGRGLETPFARKEAALNLAKIITSMAGILGIANTLFPNSVEKDPRGANIGKIKIGDTTFDISGGAGSLITLASRLVPTIHNGEWGLWSKSSTSGVYTNLLSSKYGATTAGDVFWNFWEGKLSPALGLIRDFYKGQDYNGNPMTIQQGIKNAITPLPVSTGIELWQDPNSAPFLLSLILDGLGISTNTKPSTQNNWNINPGVELQQFKDKVGQDKFNQANTKFNQLYNDWFKSVKNLDKYKKLSDDDKQKVITKKKTEIKDKIFKQYNFVYKQQKSKSLPKL